VFSPGITARSVTVTIVGDQTAEPSETFRVDLTEPRNATLADGQSVVTVLDDDTLTKAEITSPAPGSHLSTSTVTFTWTAGAGAVQYWLSVGTTPGGTQIYNASQGTDLSRTVSGLPTDGSPVHVRLWSLLGADWAVNDYSYVAAGGLPRLSIADAAVTEGHAGTTNATFTVTLAPATGTTVTVGYATSDGTATAGSDYTAASGTLTFAPQQTTQSFTVTVHGDRVIEPDETFQVVLSGLSGATLGRATAEGRILNDDHAARDLDGDGHSDIVWRHTGGALYVWQMNGTAIEASSYLLPIGLGWTIQGMGDFNGDGKSDVLWREATSGATYVWFMNGAAMIGAGYTASQTDNTWTIQGVGDFDGDGKSDILWRHTGGALYVWQMDGTSTKKSSYLLPISLAWQIQGLGDFDGDGKTDILWRETPSGATYVWFMDGASTISAGYTASQTDNTWTVQGVGDFGADGRSDILWRHTGGALYVWQMEGTATKKSSYLPPISLAWQIKQLGDFDGDGKTDILWREDPSGSTYEWLMDGAVTVGAGYTASQTDNSWVIQAR